MIKRLIPLSTLLLAVLCQAHPVYASDELAVLHPWVREAPPTSKVLAAYMTLMNTGKSVITINRISSPDFESAELHRTVISNGMASMQHIKQLDVPANERVKLEPGGLHLMLFNPQHTLTAGDKVPLTIHLSNETSMAISATVIRQSSEEQPHHH